MRILSKNGQSILEYSILLALILASLLIMQAYVKRCYQGRLKQEADQIGQQYSPGHTTSLIVTNTSTDSTTYIGGNLSDGKDVSDGLTLTLTNTSTTFTKKEGVDSFALEK